MYLFKTAQQINAEKLPVFFLKLKKSELEPKVNETKLVTKNASN